MKTGHHRFVALAIGAMCTIFLAADRTEAAPIWIEIGDAGGLAAPQFLAGGSFGEIVGSLDVTDLEDVYAFHWAATTDFSAINLEPVLPDWIGLVLYDFTGGIAGPLLTQTTSSAGGIAVSALSAGDYLLQLIFVPDPGADPPYRIAISGSTADPINPVPEPSTLALLATGLVSFAFRKRFRTPAMPRRAFLAIATFCAVSLTAGRTEAAPIWIEVGDAGGLAAPQFLTGGSFGEIVGNLDLTDVEDVYAFHWAATTDFSAINLEPVVPDFIGLSLYEFDDRVAGRQVGFATSGSGLFVPQLAAGDYLLQAVFLPDPGEDDPPYRIAISGSSADPVNPVPEPSTLFLLAGGLASLGFKKLGSQPHV